MNSSDQTAEASPDVRLTVHEADAGKRLDAYLAAHIPDWSRVRLQRLIEGEDVLVNGRPVKSSYKLRNNDEVELDLVSAPAADFIPENIPLDIVFEDESLIVVNKPAGLIVHPGAGINSGTLANALAFHFAQLSTQAGKFRPGIVHRLDKGTSGLLVVAKNEVVHDNLAEQFRQRTVFKSYLALVHGSVERDSGRIEQAISRDPRNRVRMAVSRSGRSALSLYRMRKRFKRFTLLDVELKTGRTHQIRVHLSWLKHPVVGDEVYGGGRDKTVQDHQVRAEIRNLGRQFLHAQELAFIHPGSQQLRRFTAPLPAELLSLLTLIDGH